MSSISQASLLVASLFGLAEAGNLVHQAKILQPDMNFNSHQSPIAGESLYIPILIIHKPVY